MPSGAAGNDVIYGDLAAFRLFNFEPFDVLHDPVLAEQGDDDVLFGEEGDDHINGAGTGDDLLSGGLGYNILIGVGGTDTVVEQGDVYFNLNNDQLTSARLTTSWLRSSRLT